MKIAIDGLETLLGQTIAELLQEQKLLTTDLISILHGDIEDIAKESNSSIETTLDVDIENQLFSNLPFSEIAIVFIADNQAHNQMTIDEAVAAGSVVIDVAGNVNDSNTIPLLIKTINSHKIQGLTPGFTISLPSAATTMLTQVLSPILQNDLGLQRVNVCHLAPAAQLGRIGVEQLAGQTARLLNGMPLTKKHSLEQIAFNLLPQSGAIDDSLYSQTETELMAQTRQILEDDTFAMNASIVQAPIFYAQSQVLDLTFASPITPDTLALVLKQDPIIRLSAPNKSSPVALQAQDNDGRVIISRIRQNPDDECSLTLWCVSDNLRCGPAGNAVQIADLLIKSYL